MRVHKLVVVVWAGLFVLAWVGMDEQGVQAILNLVNRVMEALK